MAKPKKQKNETFKTGIVRLNHPHLFEPKQVNGTGKPKYSVQVLIPKKDAKSIKELVAMATRAEKKLFPDGRPDEFRWPIQDGAKYAAKLKRKGTAVDEELYSKHVVFSAKSEYPALLVGPDPNVELTDKKRVYAGVNGRVAFDVSAYDNAGTGVTFYLKIVQILKGGDPLVGKIDASEYFESEADFDDDGGDGFGETNEEEEDPVF